MPRDTTHAAALRPFAVTLSEINRGKLCDKAAVQLADLTNAVMKHEQPGTLTIKLTVRRNKGQDGTVQVLATSVVRLPEPPQTAVFFVTDDGGMSRDDPTMAPLISRSEIEEGAR